MKWNFFWGSDPGNIQRPSYPQLTGTIFEASPPSRTKLSTTEAHFRLTGAYKKRVKQVNQRQGEEDGEGRSIRFQVKSERGRNIEI